MKRKRFCSVVGGFVLCDGLCVVNDVSVKICPKRVRALDLVLNG